MAYTTPAELKIEELTAQIADMQERLNKQSLKNLTRLNKQYDLNIRHSDERNRILSAALAGRTMPYEMLVLEFAKYSAVDPDIIKKGFATIINRHSP